MRYFTQLTRVRSVAVFLDCLSPALLIKKFVLPVFICLLSTNYLLCQTITDVQPRRVTTGTVITVTGTGFYNGLQNTISFDPGGLNVTGAGSREYVNPTTIRLTVKQTDGTNRFNRPIKCTGCTVVTPGIQID